MNLNSACRLSLCILLAGVGTGVRAEIYKCVDDSGHITYSNISQKGCQRLNLEPLPTVPSPVKPATPAAKPGTSPAGFPKVDGDTQKKRDTDRRRILEEELASEERLLEEARKSLTEQEGVIEPEERNAQRCSQVCNPGKDGKPVCREVCRPGGYNQAKVDARLQPLRDKVALHERNIEALRKELANIR